MKVKQKRGWNEGHHGKVRQGRTKKNLRNYRKNSIPWYTGRWAIVMLGGPFLCILAGIVLALLGR